MAEPSTRTVERALALLATICDKGGANLADSARECDLAPSSSINNTTFWYRSAGTHGGSC